MATKINTPEENLKQRPKGQNPPAHGNGRGGAPNRNGQPNRPQQPPKPPQPKPQPPKPPQAVAAKPPVAKPHKTPTEVIVGDFITVRDLANLMERSPIDLIKVLMQYGIMAPITHSLDHDTAVILGEELHVAVKWPQPEPGAVEAKVQDEEVLPKTKRSVIQQMLKEERSEDLVERAPVVAVLGHVDHGKTTLLDRIRNTDVASGEAGGITQRTGAYQVAVDGRKLTFLDTPGHEAFTSMRARGAQVTDIVVLVVAADDGVMPQTKEAISHAKAAGVHIVVALNKVDKPNANPQRVMEELSKEGLQPEQWGGDTIVVPVSALTGMGIDDLLTNLLLVAEMEQFKANPKGKCFGTVIESELDKHRGVTATLLVQNGALKQGDTILVGTTWGRLKALFDYEGKPLKKADPGTPVVVLGIQDVPAAGDHFEVMVNDREARRIALERQEAAALAAKTPARPQVSLEDLFARLESTDNKVLNLIVRADMQGTLEPVVRSLEDLKNENVSIKILQATIGDISESDVMLAEASDAIIIGFSVNTDRAAQVRAEQSGVEIRHYDIIYKMIEDIEAALKGMLEPVYENVVLGHAQVLQLFKLRRGLIAGCMISDGIAKRGAQVRVLRNGAEVIGVGHVETLRRFTEDANEVRTGFECGLKISERSEELKEGDVIEVYEKRRVR